jgi:two-component system sensor histidine kinase DegS
MALQSIEPHEGNSWQGLGTEIGEELNTSRKALKEINLMLDQSQTELNKLVQRNSTISGQLQQYINQGEASIPEEVKQAYTNALDAQQRMIVMRGQLEKIQTEQSDLKKYVELLEKFSLYVKENQANGTITGGGRAAASLEMLINAQESERQRLSKQMHDGPAQALSNFIVQAEIAARLLEMDPIKAKEELANLKTSAMSTFQKVRSFISELRPMMLDDLGLIPTLRRYVEGFKEQYNVEISLNVNGGEKRMEPFLEVMIFRAAQELIENAVTHNLENPGKITINISLNIDTDAVKMTVDDNGVGFDVSEIQKTGGLGLKLIRERVELMNGSMNIDTTPGKGCAISILLPFVEIQTGSKEK